MSFAPQRVVVPIDVDDASDRRFAEAAVDHAVEVAKSFDAELVIVSVVPVPLLPSGFDVTFDAAGAMEGLHQARLEHAQTMIEPLLKRAKAAGVHAVARVIGQSDSVPDAILAEAADSKADLIAMPTHGRRGLARLLLGSVAERVARLSTCPVLLWRPAEDG
jgi:nucleotide-binding universal stress UspA family protein